MHCSEVDQAEYWPEGKTKTLQKISKSNNLKLQKKSKSEVGGTLHIILGTSKGGLALFSFATAKVSSFNQHFFFIHKSQW